MVKEESGMPESRRDLTERTFAFGVRVVALCRALDRREPTSRILAGQLLRSGTSVGANVEQTRRTQAKLPQPKNTKRQRARNRRSKL